VKRLIPAIAIILGWASAAWAAPPVTLTTLRAIRTLTNAEASRKLPVAFEATVTYYRDYENTLFVQDGGAAVLVFDAQEDKLVPGDRIRVEGKTDADLSPDVRSEKITLLGHGAVPQPVPASFDELIRGQRDCVLVTVSAVVRAADLEKRPNLRDASLPREASPSMVTSTRLQLLAAGGNLEASIDSGEDASALASLLDAQVNITGIASRLFDGKTQQTSLLLHVSSMADVKVLRRAAVSVLSLPVTSVDKLLTGYRARDLTKRIRVRGTITYYEPGRAVVLQSGSRSLWIATRTASSDLRINDAADATGFPDAHSGFLTLIDGEIWDSQAPASVPAKPAAWQQLASSDYPFGLVSVEAEAMTEVRAALRDEYVFSSQGELFTAVYSRLNGAAQSMQRIPPGSRVRVTGVAIPENPNPFRSRASFQILLRSPDDIVIVARPSLLAVSNLNILLGLMLLVVIAVGFWGWTLKRKVRRQAGKLATMAYLEQRRTRILADINSAKPLVEILESITEMVSFMLGGAPCWCGVNDGARLGKYPVNANRLHVLHEEIPARSGPPLGTIFAGFDFRTIPGIHRTFVLEKEVLSGGAKLAMLAMETRRLYSDLVSRSELDLLTNVPNRRSLGEHLDTLIEEARQNASVFGLIYIDLDKFKPINDRYGHHVGDLFLQEVALRMKQQLRSHDLLARLGGDEFAVLLPMVRNRTRIEEIALRLEHCFREPFFVDGKYLQGSASFGYSIYPEDGATGDSLLSAADAAMYVAKNFRKKIAAKTAGSEEPVPADQSPV
jgi:diguanylate cyclase (GGDEF)-like protein